MIFWHEAWTQPALGPWWKASPRALWNVVYLLWCHLRGLDHKRIIRKIWRFPKIGLPPNSPNHPFIDGCSIINHLSTGHPHPGNPHLSLVSQPGLLHHQPLDGHCEDLGVRVFFFGSWFAYQQTLQVVWIVYEYEWIWYIIYIYTVAVHFTYIVDYIVCSIFEYTWSTYTSIMQHHVTQISSNSFWDMS